MVQAGAESGKAVAEIAAGTAAGGPWGAILSAAWAMRHSLFKVLVCICLFLLIIVILICSIPSIVLDSVFGLNGVPPAEEVTLESSYSEMSNAVSAVIDAGYDQSLARVEEIILDVMTDDAPLRCRHYYCSAAGSTERTEVYVVPEQDFMRWYEAEKNFPDEGVKLHAQTTFWQEKAIPKQG